MQALAVKSIRVLKKKQTQSQPQTLTLETSLIAAYNVLSLGRLPWESGTGLSACTLRIAYRFNP